MNVLKRAQQQQQQYPVWLSFVRLIAAWLIVGIIVSIFHWWQVEHDAAVWYQVFLVLMLIIAGSLLAVYQYLLETFLPTDHLPYTKCVGEGDVMPPAKRSQFVNKIMFYRAMSLVLFLFALTIVMATILRDATGGRMSIAWLAVFVPAILAVFILCCVTNLGWSSARPAKICLIDVTALLFLIQLLVLWATLEFVETTVSWSLLLLPSWIALAVLFFPACFTNCYFRCCQRSWCPRGDRLAVVYYYTILLVLFLLLLGVSLTAGETAPLSELPSEHRVFIATLPFLVGLTLLLVLGPLIEICCLPLCVPHSSYFVTVS